MEDAASAPDRAVDGSLDYRLNQQRILADFGMEALRSRDVDAMIQRAAELCAEGMRSRLSKVLAYRSANDRLFVKAGVGWSAGVVGVADMGADLESPAGFAFKTGEPVISNHLSEETRFRTPAFMAEHGVRRAINVLIEVEGRRYGVLEVDSTDEGRFEAPDLAFMNGFASLIGVAVERHDAEERLRHAIAHQELLTREASHRVKNSLTLVSAMLSLQMQAQDEPEVTRVLGDAQARIVTIAQAHDQLWRGDRVGVVDLRELVCDLARRLGEQSPAHSVSCDIGSLTISADTAIPIGLLVTELVTNAIKYAYPDGGPIAVRAVADDARLRIIVRDEGRGFAGGNLPTAGSTRSLGLRMIFSLARQLSGEVRFEAATPGTVATLDMPHPALPDV